MTPLFERPETRADAILAWYDHHHRTLPWRVAPTEGNRGVRPEPYRVWLSEIMLQQTTVAAVKSYFEAFTARWPTVFDLADAHFDDVMKAWAGLGYYSRARNLKACADRVVADFGGEFPRTELALKALPGIGDYTAAAIAAIAFGEPCTVVDGNVERVVTRLEAIETPLPQAKAGIRTVVGDMVPGSRPGDFAQAMMDLGATICTPKNPACALCPLMGGCKGRVHGDPQRFPVRPPKLKKPVRKGAAFVAFRRDGSVLLRKRMEKGLLGGMAEPPGTAWTARIDGGVTSGDAPLAGNWREAGTIRHVFTHFELDLTVFRADGVFSETPAGCWWSKDIHNEALPSVMKKAIEAAMDIGSSSARKARSA